MPDQANSIQVLRLAVSDPAIHVDLNVLDQLDLAATYDTARVCAGVRDIAHQLPGESTEALREALGLIGSVHESLIIASGCEVELECHRQVADADPAAGTAMEMARRFFAIAEGNEVLGVGHRLINAVVRAFSVDPALRPVLATEMRSWADQYQPFDPDRASWLSLNTQTRSKVTKVAATSRHRAIHLLAAELERLEQSHEWQDLSERRGEVFHRSRPESSNVTGVDMGTGYHRTLYDAEGRHVGYSYRTSLNRYADGDHRERMEAQAARAALRAMGNSARRIAIELAAAVEPLTCGRWATRQVGTTHSVQERIGGHWDPSACGCCDDNIWPRAAANGV